MLELLPRPFTNPVTAEMTDASLAPVVTYQRSAVYAVLDAPTANDEDEPAPRCHTSKPPLSMTLRSACGVHARWLTVSIDMNGRNCAPSYNLCTSIVFTVSNQLWNATSAPDAPGPIVGAELPEYFEVIAANDELISAAAAAPVSGEPGRRMAPCDMRCFS